MIILSSTNSGVVSSIIPYDVSARNYIRNVEAQDGQPLEAILKKAINDFIVGCKNDGIWDAIKGSCILAGARTLNGALIPLVGNAPTNTTFISTDYDRKTGLITDGTKYLDLGYNNNDTTNLPQSDNHASIYINSLGAPTAGMVIFGTSLFGYEGALSFTYQSINGYNITNRTVAGVNNLTFNKFIGTAKTEHASFIVRTNGVTTSSSTSSGTTPSSGQIGLFGNGAGGNLCSSGLRISFYSLGKNLDLVKLDNRISTLMNIYANL